ncbi:MAG: SUKH-4 family immunity protein [Flavobacteriales bacterium]|nr:SUKH-4 family immunity protein [Flavobacteriales bacterium]
MRPEEFKERWDSSGEATVPMKASDLRALDLNDDSVAFLSIAGLPEAAAPFLSFAEGSGTPNYCVRLTKRFNFLQQDFDRYVSIGSDGSGDPIAIDTSDGDCIVALDHEDGFAKRYMNSSLDSLAVFLLGFRDFVQGLMASKGSSAFMNGDFTREDLEALHSKFQKVDPRALVEGHFWETELQMLSANRRS